eukprot:scaffold192649_cov63-Attheya_sp.AAC.1
MPGELGTRTERDGPRAAGSRKRLTGPHSHKSGTRGKRGWEGAPVCTRVTLDFMFRGIGRKSQLYTIL